MNAAPLTSIRQNDTHRLIPSNFTDDADTPLAQIADTSEHLQDLFELDHATDDSVPGIANHELVFGIPHYRLINGVFTHAHPQGSRFNGPDRGAWYAGFEPETSQAEIAFHKTRQYTEINRFDDSVYYDDYLADFNGEFHDIRNAANFITYLDPDSYVASQQFSERLLNAGSLGIIFPSVRHSRGTCIVCFRPPAVGHVRRQYRYCFTWAGNPVPNVSCTALVGR